MLKRLFDRSSSSGDDQAATKAQALPETEKPTPSKVELLPPPETDDTARLLAEQLLADKVETPPSVLKRVAGRLRKPWGNKGKGSKHVHAHEQDIHHRLEVAFEALHREFDSREKALEKKLAQAAVTYEKKIRRTRWLLVPVGLLAVLSLVYLFYMIQLMGSAMTSISTDITSMNTTVSSMDQNMAAMSNDTGEMVQSIHRMDQSMGNLNYNVGSMNQQMGAMNHNVAAMNRSIAPIGDAARPIGGFMGAMKSFMPF